MIGRPMPPAHELVHLANVLHHDQPPVSEELILRCETFGGQRWQIDVVDFADPRVAALLRARREDEVWQLLHRARPSDLDAQLTFGDGKSRGARRRLRIVLHTSHPVRGLRIDELLLPADARDVNAERAADAAARVWAAAERRFAAGQRVNLSAIARDARADKRTVAKIVGTSVETHIREILYNRLHRRPQTGEA